jgi:hypothetical protein
MAEERRGLELQTLLPTQQAYRTTAERALMLNLAFRLYNARVKSIML